MAGSLWSRLVGRRNAKAVEREDELERMSPAERDFVEESVDDRKADAAAEAHLGGGDPARLIDDAPPKN